MNKQGLKKTIVAILTLGLIAYVTVLISVRQRGIEPVLPKGVGVSGPREFMTAKGINYVEYQAGKTKFSIQAKAARLTDGKIGFFKVAFLKAMELEGVRVEFYERGKVFFTIEGERALMKKIEDDFIFEKKVVAYSSAGRRLETEKLRWERKTNKLVVEAPFTLKTGQGTIQGERLRTTVGLREGD